MPHTTITTHLKQTIKLAYPIMLGQLSHILIMISDNVMVGNYSSDALAAAALANSIFITSLTFGIGVSLGLTPLVAAANGAKDYKLCREYLRHSLVFFPIVGLVLTLFVTILAYNLHWFNDIPKITLLAKDFLLLLAFTLVPLMLAQVFKQFMEGLSSTKESMFVNLGGTFLNIILNYLLIYGKFGFPEWGLFGAGLATLITRVIMGLIMPLIFILRQKYKEYHLRIFQFHTEYFIKLTKIGFPVGMQMVFESGAFAFSAIMIGWIGKVELAAHQIALNVGSATFLVTTGIAAAAAVRTAHFRGLKDIKNMRLAGISAVFMGAVFMAFCAILILIFKDWIPAQYVKEEDVRQISAILLLLVAIFQLSDGIQVVAIGSLRGLEDVKIPVIITLIAYWVTGVPVGYLFGFIFKMGVEGIWYGLISSLSVAAIVLFVRFLKISKKILHD